MIYSIISETTRLPNVLVKLADDYLGGCYPKVTGNMMYSLYNRVFFDPDADFQDALRKDDLTKAIGALENGASLKSLSKEFFFTLAEQEKYRTLNFITSQISFFREELTHFQFGAGVVERSYYLRCYIDPSATVFAIAFHTSVGKIKNILLNTYQINRNDNDPIEPALEERRPRK